MGLSEYIKTARKTESERKTETEGERKSLFLESGWLSVSLSLSFISLCVISFPHTVLLLSLPPPTLPLLSASRSVSASLLRSRVGSWEQKSGDRQDKSRFLILQLSASLPSGKKTASQDREFPARCIPPQLLSLTGRQEKKKDRLKDQ